ncbi:uncharacterized protein BP5553_01420 [Venustampulla echinocandica]|uniref:Uncharacterized protein n=1 Tax=Venustampulla echinocandica TaxID=2656787 RepID=A0A370U0Z1_9HELO|nr:uncharacterized protein BP5553_01420 [Venustampulla echinocandica]RDL41441.1 hypothetical protein BP5553_01420 [Venustampulla echinocandica]
MASFDMKTLSSGPDMGRAHIYTLSAFLHDFKALINFTHTWTPDLDAYVVAGGVVFKGRIGGGQFRSCNAPGKADLPSTISADTTSNFQHSPRGFAFWTYQADIRSYVFAIQEFARGRDLMGQVGALGIAAAFFPHASGARDLAFVLATAFRSVTVRRLDNLAGAGTDTLNLRSKASLATTMCLPYIQMPSTISRFPKRYWIVEKLVKTENMAIAKEESS